MKVSSDFVNDRGVPFLAVLIEPGDRYGHRGCFVAQEASIEFYDRRYLHTDFGQFVSRYYVRSLTGGDMERWCRFYGLRLDDGVPDWTVTGENMRQVFRELLR